MGGSNYGNSATQQVTLTNDYWISKYPITNAQYNGSTTNPNRPDLNVSWAQANIFAQNIGDGRGRLPTEAEWEFAARGGNKGKRNGYIYSGSNTLGNVGWYIDNQQGSNASKDVGLKLPNELGIHDMSGNVWEWCSDWYGNYSPVGVENPTGPATGDYRVLRGGSWRVYEQYCKVGYRNYYPSNISDPRGIRVVVPHD
jgi:formylglycine-generating enzyme required for sulfatase activity